MSVRTEARARLLGRHDRRTTGMLKRNLPPGVFCSLFLLLFVQGQLSLYYTLQSMRFEKVGCPGPH